VPLNVTGRRGVDGVDGREWATSTKVRAGTIQAARVVVSAPPFAHVPLRTVLASVLIELA
jgi:hypothetical protein